LEAVDPPNALVPADMSDPAVDFDKAVRDAGVKLPLDRAQPARQGSGGEGFAVRGTDLDMHTRAAKCLTKTHDPKEPSSTMGCMRGLCVKARTQQVKVLSEEASFKAQLDQWDASEERIELPEGIVKALLCRLSSFGHRSFYIPQVDGTLGTILYPHEDIPHKLRRITAAIRAARRAIDLKINQACKRIARENRRRKAASNGQHPPLPDPVRADFILEHGPQLFPWDVLLWRKDANGSSPRRRYTPNPKP